MCGHRSGMDTNKLPTVYYFNEKGPSILSTKVVCILEKQIYPPVGSPVLIKSYRREREEYLIHKLLQYFMGEMRTFIV